MIGEFAAGKVPVLGKDVGRLRIQKLLATALVQLQKLSLARSTLPQRRPIIHAFVLVVSAVSSGRQGRVWVGGTCTADGQRGSVTQSAAGLNQEEVDGEQCGRRQQNGGEENTQGVDAHISS